LAEAVYGHAALMHAEMPATDWIDSMSFTGEPQTDETMLKAHVGTVHKANIYTTDGTSKD
jgi:hypothetical protein